MQILTKWAFTYWFLLPPHLQAVFTKAVAARQHDGVSEDVIADQTREIHFWLRGHFASEWKKNAAGVIRDWRCILKRTFLPAVASLKVLLVIWNQQQVEVAVSPIVRIPLCSDSESQTHCSQSETVTYNWCLVWFQLMFLLQLYCGTYATFAYKASYLHLQFFCLLQPTKNGGEAER